jgi:hypothetical protein
LCQNGDLSILFSVKEIEKNRGVGTAVLFGQKFPCAKRKSEMVRCRDGTTSYFVAKVRGEVDVHFHAVAMSMLLTLLLTSFAIFQSP